MNNPKRVFICSPYIGKKIVSIKEPVHYLELYNVAADWLDSRREDVELFQAMYNCSPISTWNW